MGRGCDVFITVEQFVDFLNREQRDPRLNEILYPYYDLKKARALIEQFEPTKGLRRDGMLDLVQLIFI